MVRSKTTDAFTFSAGKISRILPDSLLVLRSCGLPDYRRLGLWYFFELCNYIELLAVSTFSFVWSCDLRHWSRLVVWRKSLYSHSQSNLLRNLKKLPLPPVDPSLKKVFSPWERSLCWLLGLTDCSLHHKELLPQVLPGARQSTLPTHHQYSKTLGSRVLVNSEVTSNDNFYQVDIDVFVPSVNASTWSLQVTGLIQNPKTYSLAEFQSLPKTVEYNTFECVSNNVQGNLISNAEWGGVKLSDLFSNLGGLLAGAEYVVFYSVDGYSVGIPIAKALESDSILAYEMNSGPLPQNHGYPLRAVNPGLYGMMSAKWIRKISVVNAAYMGYWQTRGWSNTGIVQTLAFIIAPTNAQSLSANSGTVVVGGYAYAGNRGISKVEVSIDNGKTWQTAVLKPPISNGTWALWAFEWTTTQTGSVNIYARATDGLGSVQTSTQTGNFPSGATGYASSTIRVIQ